MKISIVIPSYNQGRYLDAALRSAVEQDYADKELLFIDGGSNDETLRIAERYCEHIDYFVSEPDSGQSDALRKGFARATGDVLTWLNTDDLLLPGVLSEVAEAFNNQAQREWVLGNVVWIAADGSVMRCRKGEAYSPLLPRIGVLGAYGPSSFFRRGLYERVGGVAADLHYLMDTDLWWRFIADGQSFHRLKRYTWALRLHADAKTSAPMFAVGSNPALDRSIRARREELIRVGAAVARLAHPTPAWVRSAAKTAVRASSARCVRGVYDSYVWRGRPIEDLVEALCPTR